MVDRDDENGDEPSPMISSNMPSSSNAATDDDDIFDEDRLRSRLCVVRKYVSKPIPRQPWNDDAPAFIPFRENHDDDYYKDDGGENEGREEGGRTNGYRGKGGGGGIVIGSARHAANIPLLKSMNVVAVLNCASGVRLYMRICPASFFSPVRHHDVPLCLLVPFLRSDR